MKAAIWAFAAAAVTVAPSYATTDGHTQVAVHYADLDLDTLEGREVLARRIRAAAREVCGINEAQTTGSRMPSHSRRTCYEKATSQIGESIARAVERRDSKG